MAERTADDGTDRPPVSPAFLIMTMGRQLRSEIERDLAASGLTLRHLSALGHLGREPGLSYSELARRAGVTAQSMQATLRQLEALGAVERRTPPGRGRTAELHVTDVGTRLRDAGRDTIGAADRRLLATLPEHDVATLGRLLGRLFRPGGPDPRVLADVVGADALTVTDCGPAIAPAGQHSRGCRAEPDGFLRADRRVLPQRPDVVIGGWVQDRPPAAVRAPSW